MDEFKKKMQHICTYIYMYNEVLVSHKKEWNPAICKDTDTPWEHNAKWINPEKDKYPMILLTYGI